MKVNVLIDGGFLEQALKKKKRRLSIVEAELFRVLYYDCYPFEGKAKDPQGTDIDFSTTPTVKFKKTLLNDISKHERYALRLGQLSFRGWKAHTQGNPTSPPTPIFQQKGVDMKCGLDIAVMSINKWHWWYHQCHLLLPQNIFKDINRLCAIEGKAPKQS